MSEASLQSSRRTVFWVLALTFAGSLTGLTIGRWSGGVQGAELWLVSSSFAFSSVVLAILVRRPFDRVPWVAPLCSGFFLVYLTTGALLGLDQPSIVGSFMVYLLWFFPLVVFNRFVNTSPKQAALSACISAAPVGLALARVAAQPQLPGEAAILLIYCLSSATLTLVTSLFANYREFYIKQQERVTAELTQKRLLSENEQGFRRLFANAASGIGWLSMDGRCEHLNRTFGRMIGRAAEDLQGVRFAEFLHRDDRQHWDQLLEEMQLAGHGDFATDLRLFNAAGTELRVRLSFSVIAPSDHQPQAIAFVCLDTTEAHRMEAQLRQAQRLEAVGHLTGGVAHDFNNLLTVILGNTEVLEGSLDDQPELKEMATMTRMAAERGATLVSQLLAFSRQQPLQARVVDLGALIRGMAGMLRQAAGANVQLDINVAERLLASIDATQMHSALLNLVINARDAMPSGGLISIELSLPPQANGGRDLLRNLPPHECLLLRVADNGSGMAPEVASKIFEPFFTTKQSGRGTGLGMAMVYGFITQSGGRIVVESAQGEGTTILIYLARHTDGCDPQN